MMAYFALAAHHLVLLLCAIKIAIVGKNSSFSLSWEQLKPYYSCDASNWEKLCKHTVFQVSFSFVASAC